MMLAYGMRGLLRWLLPSLILCLAASLPALAHPHVFIETSSKLLHGQGGFTAVEHRWVFDEYYSSTAIEGLDANNDGVYSREELAELAKVNIDGLKEFAYFTTVTVDGKPWKTDDVKDYWLEHKDGLLTLVFVVPLAEPINSHAKKPTRIKLVVADQSFFIGFTWAKTDPIRLGDGAPKQCKAALGNAEGDGETPSVSSEEGALAGALSQQFPGAVSFDKAGFVTCNP